MKHTYNIVVCRNTILHTSPVIMYSFMLINYYVYHNLTLVIHYFFIEWVVSAPIIIISILNLKKSNILYYFLLPSLNTVINLCGYMSVVYYEPSSPPWSVSHILLYGGCFVYLCIIAILTFVYVYSKPAIETQLQYHTLNKHKMYKYALLGMSWIWSIYPIIAILYITTILDAQYSIVSFLILDFVSKFWNSFITTGYELYKYNIMNPHTKLLQTSTKIYPLEYPSNLTEAGEADYTLSQVPVVTDVTITAPV